MPFQGSLGDGGGWGMGNECAAGGRGLFNNSTPDEFRNGFWGVGFHRMPADKGIDYFWRKFILWV
jgi:hypothetical protein